MRNWDKRSSKEHWRRLLSQQESQPRDRGYLPHEPAREPRVSSRLITPPQVGLTTRAMPLAEAALPNRTGWHSAGQTASPPHRWDQVLSREAAGQGPLY